MTTITLKKPLNDGKLTEITLREPTMKELRKFGIPVGRDGALDFDKAAGLISTLGAIAMPLVDQLSAKDAMAIAAALVPMLVDEDAQPMQDAAGNA